MGINNEKASFVFLDGMMPLVSCICPALPGMQENRVMGSFLLQRTYVI